MEEIAKFAIKTQTASQTRELKRTEIKEKAMSDGSCGLFCRILETLRFDAIHSFHVYEKIEIYKIFPMKRERNSILFFCNHRKD